MRRLLKRWPVLIAALALAVPVVVSTASGAQTQKAAPQAQAILATADHPVIDTDFLYHEEYFSSTQFISRVAGADGPPSDPSDVNNLPQNYNGANEYYAWWKSELTNTDDSHMGPMGKFVTAKDHFAPCCRSSGNQTYPFQLDDATVTVPGLTCPGQSVLISGHNDSTPTPTNVASGAQSGSATPGSRMRSGNWGNGSPYDANSGITMGMAELQGLLRWYQLNGTYPKRTLKVGLFDAEETGLVGSGEYSQTDTPTTLAADAAAGDTVIKVGSVNGIFAGDNVVVDQSGQHEVKQVAAVGTSGADGTGLTLASPLANAYPAGTQVTRKAIGLIPDGPQGQYVMVANMDQNGMEYPAYHWGTQHYLNDIVGGTVGPWYTNINAVPLSPNRIYPETGDGWARIKANMPAEQAFRAATADSVAQAFQVLGAKYNFSMPLENPLRLDQVGSTPVDPSTQTVPAYSKEDMENYSPVVDDALGRTDQVSFINRGIPGYGIVGAYDSSNSAVGGFENPYPANYTSKPGLGQYGTYDTSDDTIAHLNYWASGTTHGPGGVDQPSEALKRALELPATWTDYLIQRDQYGGAVPQSDHDDVAYFETDPAKPTTTNTVTFDASFSRAPDGSTNDLKYFWDFGDGHWAATTKQKVTHTYASTKPAYYDVRLYTLAPHGRRGYYRQALAVEFQPTLYPDTPPASEPKPPATDPCGTLSHGEQGFMNEVGNDAFGRLRNGVTEIDGEFGDTSSGNP